MSNKDKLLDDALTDSDSESDDDMKKKPNNIKNETQTKRRVGRPCKTKINQLLVLNGIVDKPKDEQDVMELICHDPSVFKKIIGLLKNYHVSDVEFVFNNDSITIATEDQSKHTKIFKKIYGNKLYLYYLDKKKMNSRGINEIRICVSRDDLDEIFNSIDKTYNIVKMWITEADIKCKLHINLHHTPYDDDQNFVVPIKDCITDLHKPVFDVKTKYPIKFTLTTKGFKQIIEKMSAMYSRFTIKKESHNSYLTFEAQIECGKKMEVVFNNNDKIMLSDNTKPDDITSIDIMMEHILPLSKTVMGEFITIWIDNNEDILFQTSLSEICSIEVFTKTAS
jgi:hypothetical protein